MVASQSQLASEIGVDVMKRGGNAVDAAVAVAIALAVTYPEAGNLGGGGFMLIRFADGITTAIDYREMAPQAANRNIFVDKNGELIRGEGSSTSATALQAFRELRLVSITLSANTARKKLIGRSWSNLRAKSRLTVSCYLIGWLIFL
jgi:gamma-glutamyltranspeptidase